MKLAALPFPKSTSGIQQTISLGKIMEWTGEKKKSLLGFVGQSSVQPLCLVPVLVFSAWGHMLVGKLWRFKDSTNSTYNDFGGDVHCLVGFLIQWMDVRLEKLIK